MTRNEEPKISPNQQGMYTIPLHPQVAPMPAMAPNSWVYGLCGCFGDCDKCCIGAVCPCIAYGEIHHRLKNKRNTEYSRCCNGPCWGFCGLSIFGMQWIMGMMQRGEARRKYNLEGSGCGDCMKHLFCGCCALIQEDRETETRNQLLVPANVLGYQASMPMTYNQVNGVTGHK